MSWTEHKTYIFDTVKVPGGKHLEKRMNGQVSQDSEFKNTICHVGNISSTFRNIIITRRSFAWT